MNYKSQSSSKNYQGDRNSDQPDAQKLTNDETVLPDNEIGFRILLDKSPQAICFLDVETQRVIKANPAFLNILGYAADEAGSLARFNLAEENKAAANSLMQRVLAAGDISQEEYLWQRKDGQMVQLQVTASKIQQDGRTLVLFIGHDLTRRKQAEQVLRASEERYRSTLDNMLEGCQIIGFDWRYLYVNDTVARHARHTKEELLGHTMMEVYPGIEKTEVFSFLQRCMKERQPHSMENEFVYPDGTQGWFVLSIQPVPEGTFVLSIDITPRKQAEAELQRYREHLEELVAERTAALEVSQARYWQLFDNAPDSVVLMDIETGEFVDFNERAHTTLGYTREEFRQLKIIDIEENKSEAEIMDRLLKVQREGSDVFETIQRTKNGESHNVRVAVGLLKIDGKEYVQSIWSDITRQKKAEREIRALNDDLKSRQAALEAANDELEAFAYSVSHDLRSPLRGVDGYSKLLLEDYAGQLDEDGRFMLTQVRESAQQMGQLIDDLLEFSRMGRREMLFQPCDVREIVHNLFNDIQQIHPDRRLRLEMGEVPACSADAAMIREVMRNLLDNAVKFTRNCDEAVIEVASCASDAGMVTYFVRDNGIGFDSRFLDKLFQVFQRLHRVEDYEGTGIGLALVRRIIQRHGGQVWAESQPGKGATFYFSLPCKKEEETNHV